MKALKLTIAIAALAATGLAAPPDDATSLRRLLNDWAGLTRYGSDNSEIPAPKAGEQRVVFLGDDITQGWQNFFPDRPYLNRGIEGQTSGQMLLRFRQDVLSLKPKVVIIQAGSNDLAGLTGPATQPMIAENIMSMVELAKLHGIQVVLAAVTPVCDCAATRQTLRRVPGKILGFNGWLKEYASEAGAVYLDLHAALSEGRTLKPAFTTDGFLLNQAAYQTLAPLAEKAISEALSRPK
ncbi:MAG TPA: GDSL-type esterase/lipase family protein [Bryobacteraceae bacterium]|nr:GDSL-type esterase/lipase family protein [Bryobacteraceae bacterium]